MPCGKIPAKSTRNTRDEAQSGKRIDQHHRSNENSGLLVGPEDQSRCIRLKWEHCPRLLALVRASAWKGYRWLVEVLMNP